MDQRLETFLTVCSTMNYRRAAEQLHLTQPAVTKQIQALEALYGVRLFTYDSRKLKKTPQGETLEIYAISQRYQDEELRRAAARLSFATMTSLPIQVLWTTLATLILTVCGVNFMGPNTIVDFPPTAYYLISSIASFLSIVLPFSFFLFFGKRKLSDTVLVEKNGVLNSVLLVFAGLAVSVLMNIPANRSSQLL